MDCIPISFSLFLSLLSPPPFIPLCQIEAYQRSFGGNARARTDHSAVIISWPLPS